jgi:hypothetical protein
MVHVRKLMTAICVVAILCVASAATTLAGTMHQVQVAGSDHTYTISANCIKHGKLGLCPYALRVVVGPHVEYRIDAGSASACSGNNPLNWALYAWSPANLSWNDTNNLDWRLEFNGQDLFNQCSAWTNWNNVAVCQGWVGYYCNTSSKGSFWDGGKNANTDWLNQEISYQDYFGCNNYQDAMRGWTSPSGGFTHANYWNYLNSHCGG